MSPFLPSSLDLSHSLSSHLLCFFSSPLLAVYPLLSSRFISSSLLFSPPPLISLSSPLLLSSHLLLSSCLLLVSPSLSSHFDSLTFYLLLSFLLLPPPSLFLPFLSFSVLYFFPLLVLFYLISSLIPHILFSSRVVSSPYPPISPLTSSYSLSSHLVSSPLLHFLSSHPLPLFSSCLLFPTPHLIPSPPFLFPPLL